MATVVLKPPPDTDVVSFFAIARLAAQSDSRACIDALIDQLSAIIDESPPHALTDTGRAAYLRAVLPAAAGRLQRRGRRLLLVADGLDEDRGARTGSGLPTIASILPAEAIAGLKVIVASRSHWPLPADVPGDHPLRSCPVRRLAVSRHSARIAERASAELDELLIGDAGGREVVAMVAAAGGGLTLPELEALTGLPKFRVDQILSGTLGRNPRETHQPQEPRS